MARNSLPKIDHLSYSELSSLIEQAEELRAERQDEERKAVLERLRAEAQASGFSLDEIMGRHASGRRKRSDAGVKLKPKFIGPKGETYTGRGPTPKWLKDLEAKGHKRDKYLAKK